MMEMTPAGRKALVEVFEGLRLVAYRDSVGVLTIGYGHTSAAGAPAVRAGLTITEDEADQILARDLGRVEATVFACLHVPVLPRQFDAMVSLAFNVGCGAFKSSSLLRTFNARNDAEAAAAFLEWDRAGGRVIAGLMRRRAAERSWFLQGSVVVAKAVDGANPGPPEAPAPTGLYEIDHPDGWFARMQNRVVLYLAVRQ
jgi:lysozyme